MKNLKILFAFIVLLMSLKAVGQTNSERIKNQLTGLEAEIDSLLNLYHAAGLSVAIVHEGDLEYAKGFGYRDIEKKLPVDEHTIFGIGSCTKSFTASILGILEGQNKLSLADKPSVYIPELIFNRPEMDNDIQIHHLLSHSTGISGAGLDYSGILFNSDEREIVEKIAYFNQTSPTGEGFNYNNTLYGVAGIIGERVTNQKLDMNLSQFIFRPLEMNSSFYGFDSAHQQANFSLGYAVDNNNTPVTVLPEIIPSKAAAGAIFSTVVDMAKWVNLWLNKGVFKGKQILPANYIKESTSAKQRISEELNYGYGWIMQYLHGYQTVEHSGAISGYSSNVIMFPSENIGIVILANQTVSNISNQVTDIIVRRMLDIKAEPINHSIRFEVKPQVSNLKEKTILNPENKPGHALLDFTGDFHNPAYGNIEISFNEGTLYANFPYTKLRLQHHEGYVFIDYFTEEIPLFMGNFMFFDFRLNDSQDINGFFLNLDSNPIFFTKVRSLERERITKTLMDYIEGTANGEPERLRSAFHPDLNLYSINQGSLSSLSGEKYISYFENRQKRNRIGRIVSIDYENDAAMAKIEVLIPERRRMYTDYLLLLKIKGEWKIIHKSFTWREHPEDKK